MPEEDLLQKLKNWRRNTANLEGVEAFQVFPHKILKGLSPAEMVLRYQNKN